MLYSTLATKKLSANHPFNFVFNFSLQHVDIRSQLLVYTLTANGLWIRAAQPLLLIDRCDFFLFFSSSCYSKQQSASRKPKRSQDGPARTTQRLIL